MIGYLSKHTITGIVSSKIRRQYSKAEKTVKSRPNRSISGTMTAHLKR